MIQMKLKDCKIEFDNLIIVTDDDSGAKINQEMNSCKNPAHVLSEYYIVRIENFNGVKTAYLSETV